MLYITLATFVFVSSVLYFLLICLQCTVIVCCPRPLIPPSVLKMYNYCINPSCHLPPNHQNNPTNATPSDRMQDQMCVSTTRAEPMEYVHAKCGEVVVRCATHDSQQIIVKGWKICNTLIPL